MDVEVCAIDFLLQARVEEEEFDGLDGSTIFLRVAAKDNLRRLSIFTDGLGHNRSCLYYFDILVLFRVFVDLR
ncbi:hypothetical protein Scep_022151 [Stephania cephalantha]|uniref:Uncharacterized protein n=1 Tax=Stephania cephalantha TaxID=152367 RepID=A0AAP0F7H2_9MAGN